jgi:saccharopine dehydrogenase-like NADP-dependent oxidoreductase
VLIKDIKNAMVVPEDDSLYLKKTYDLKHAHTVMKGRIIRKGFDTLWHLLIGLGFTNTTSKIELFENKTFLNYLRSLVQYKPEELLELSLKRQTGATAEDLEKLRWLGLFDESWPEGYREVTPASLLHYLMEQKLSLKAEDKDCIVMRHELDYTLGQYEHHFTATLVSQGEDRKNSALAKAIGLTTGAAARAILLDDIQMKGLHTPVTKKIYEPILTELLDLGVAFQVEERKVKRRETTYVPEMMHEMKPSG